MYVYVLNYVLALRSWVDAEPLDQYQEPPSSEQFEQQQESFEEGKYNMNILSLLNTISHCILILYAYKDFPSHFISYIYILWVAFWLVVLGCCAITYLGPF
jgi:hypothetical protein